MRIEEQIVVKNIEFLSAAAQQLINIAGPRRIFAFYGSMGAGKTTFIKQLCKVLNVKDAVSSPTFSLVNEYVTNSGDSIYHFDFYRIEDIGEVYDIGYEMYFDSGNYCFIEWPTKVEGLLPPDTVKIEIATTGKTSREIKVHLPSA